MRKLKDIPYFLMGGVLVTLIIWTVYLINVFKFQAPIPLFFIILGLFFPLAIIGLLIGGSIGSVFDLVIRKKKQPIIVFGITIGIMIAIWILAVGFWMLLSYVGPKFY